jgi:hypothetical protein
MGLDDYLDSEVAVAVTATAVLLSPRARRVLRKGAVYGVAGVLKAADVASAAARGVASGAGSAVGQADTSDTSPDPAPGMTA